MSGNPTRPELRELAEEVDDQFEDTTVLIENSPSHPEYNLLLVSTHGTDQDEVSKRAIGPIKDMIKDSSIASEEHIDVTVEATKIDHEEGFYEYEVAGRVPIE